MIVVDNCCRYQWNQFLPRSARSILIKYEGAPFCDTSRPFPTAARSLHVGGATLLCLMRPSADVCWLLGVYEASFPQPVQCAPKSPTWCPSLWRLRPLPGSPLRSFDAIFMCLDGWGMIWPLIDPHISRCRKPLPSTGRTAA